MSQKAQTRAFKTKRFSKSAKSAYITDANLCEAIKEVMAGQAVDLGGGVYKKKLNKTSTAPLSWPRAGTIGFMSICLPKTIVTISMTLN